jgi:hypothetical protein
MISGRSILEGLRAFSEADRAHFMTDASEPHPHQQTIAMTNAVHGATRLAAIVAWSLSSEEGSFVRDPSMRKRAPVDLVRDETIETDDTANRPEQSRKDNALLNLMEELLHRTKQLSIQGEAFC